MACSMILAALLAVFTISSYINESYSSINNQKIFNLHTKQNVLRRLEKREAELEGTGEPTSPLPTADSEVPLDPSDMGTVRNRTRKGHERRRDGQRRDHHPSNGRGCHGKIERRTTKKPISNESPKADFKRVYNNGEGVHLYDADYLSLDSHHAESHERRNRRRGFKCQGKETTDEREGEEEFPQKDE